MIYISVIFYVNDNDIYENIKNNKERFDTYYKNILNLFHTISLTNKSIIKDLKFQLITNKEVDFRYGSDFKRRRINIVKINNYHIPPNGYSTSWQGTFYYLDAIKYFGDKLSEDDILIMIDPDCICTKNISELINDIHENKILNYKIDYELNKKYNGLSMNELSNLLESEVNIKCNASFFGGEFYGFRGDVLKDISNELEEAWDISMKRFKEGKSYFHTEEHIISYVFNKKLFNFANANKYIKRMWTTPMYRNITKNDEKYMLWHLPGEKERGIIKLYKKLYDLEEIQENEYKNILSKCIGIPERNFQRMLYDYSYSTIKKIINFLKK